MKYLYFFLVLFISKPLLAHENNSEFIIVVSQDRSPITFSANTQSSFEVDWHNDGVWEKVTTTGMEEISHEFEGELDTIRIRGELNHFYAPRNIVDVVQWGGVHFTSMFKTFKSCTKLKKFSATDVPDLSSVTDMTQMFYGATSFNGDLSNWDVSSIVKMGSMFSRASSFNGDLNDWDVSSVVTMGRMFAEASSFNGNLSNWDVSSVGYMGWMFFKAYSFNSDISNWDVSSVGYMGWMFNQASSFNDDLSQWEIFKVKSMVSMFEGSDLSTENYDKLLEEWSMLSRLQNNVELDVPSHYSSSGETGRQKLIDDFNWKINDHGEINSSSNARSIMKSDALKGVSGSSISDLAGDIEWKLYDFSGQLIDRGLLTLQNGELFRWQNLQNQYQKAGILRVFDRNGNVSVIKFVKD
ncbi:BspA family leucine-rich repeat surface protein [Flammeovirga aprica]|uniref:DUF285 domain-containing protein n=1 Tax=Flammeovirga aprica JL-4 TaxID=694437 RepID=A0A7X9RYA2_9BACT|nr:BspA family leucine-rich repeat surface protein [Flammeovirga aprica]NME70895.1 DUF285 domain-containing protein [Flammeovirga aprica JL-4]